MPVHNVSNRRWSRPAPCLLCRRWSRPAPCLLHCCWFCLASLFLQLLPVPHLNLCWLPSAPLLRLWWLRKPLQFRLFRLPSAPLSHELPAPHWPSRAAVSPCVFGPLTQPRSTALKAPQSPWFHTDSLPRLHPGFSLYRFCDGLSSWLGFGSVPCSSLHCFCCESSSVSLSWLLCGSSIDSYSHSSMDSSSCISYNLPFSVPPTLLHYVIKVIWIYPLPAQSSFACTYRTLWNLRHY